MKGLHTYREKFLDALHTIQYDWRNIVIIGPMAILFLKNDNLEYIRGKRTHLKHKCYHIPCSLHFDCNLTIHSFDQLSVSEVQERLRSNHLLQMEIEAQLKSLEDSTPEEINIQDIQD